MNSLTKLKSLLFVALLAFSFAGEAQTIVGNSVQIYSNLTLHGKKVTDISNDSTLAANDSMKLPTEFAVKGYVDNKITGFTLAIGHTFVVPSQDSMLNLAAAIGDVAIIPDSSKSYILKVTPAATLGNWVLIVTPAQVISAFGRTGNVTAQYGDYNYSQIAGTPDINNPDSLANHPGSYYAPASSIQYYSSGTGINISSGVISSTVHGLFTNSSDVSSYPVINNLGYTGSQNTIYGDVALNHITSGNGNSSFGSGTLSNLTTGYLNSSFGTGGLFSLLDGHDNASFGYFSLNSLIHGNYNIGLGRDYNYNDTTYSNRLLIGDSTYHLYMRLDSAAGTAPNVIGKDGDGFWHVYKLPAGGGGTGSNNPDSLNNKPGTDYLLQTIADAAYKPIGYVPSWSEVTGKPTFATVATSGSYNDLSSKPTIPTNNNTLTNGAGYITSVPAQSFSSITGKPTTLSGYGITDGITSATAASTYQTIGSYPTGTGTATHFPVWSGSGTLGTSTVTEGGGLFNMNGETLIAGNTLVTAIGNAGYVNADFSINAFSGKGFQFQVAGVLKTKMDNNGFLIYTANPTVTLADSLKLVPKKYIDSLNTLSSTTAASTYEPKITIKNTAFNKNFGATTGTVADGGAVATSLAGKVNNTGNEVIRGAKDFQSIRTANSFGIMADTTFSTKGAYVYINPNQISGASQFYLPNSSSDTLATKKDLTGYVPTTYKQTLIAKYPIEFDTDSSFHLKQSYTDSLTALFAKKLDTTYKPKTLTDSTGIGGAGLVNGLTVYGHDKTGWMTFGGSDGRSISSNSTIGFYSPLLFDAQTGILEGSKFSFIANNYSSSYDEIMQGNYNLNMSWNGQGDIYNIDTTRHFTPASLNKSQVQYNAGGDTVRTDIDNSNMVTILNQSTALFIANPTGRPVNGQQLLFQISDNNTARAISWGTSFSFDATDAIMPTTTVLNKYIYVDCIWNENSTKYLVLSVKVRQ